MPPRVVRAWVNGHHPGGPFTQGETGASALPQAAEPCRRGPTPLPAHVTVFEAIGDAGPGRGVSATVRSRAEAARPTSSSGSAGRTRSWAAEAPTGSRAAGGRDTAAGASAPSAATADLAKRRAASGAGADTLLGLDNVIGSRYVDVLRGSRWSNVHRGGGGRKTLWGAAGTTVRMGRSASDVLRERATERRER